MTNNQRYIALCRYFERKVNDIEQETEILKNNALKRYISRYEYFIEMSKLEQRKMTIEEVSKDVLYLMKTDSTYW